MTLDSVQPERLVNTIKLQRARLNLTQEQLAQAVEVSRKTVNTVENGVFIPSTVLALRLARALNVAVEELFQLSSDSSASDSHSEQKKRVNV